MSDQKSSTEATSWKAVQEVSSASEAALVAGCLETAGIPAQVVDKSFHQTPTSGEELSGIFIAVPVEREKEALEVLSSRETAFASSPAGDERLLTEEGLREIDTEAPPKTV